MTNTEEQLDAILAKYRGVLGVPLSAQDYYNRGTLRNQQARYADALRDFDQAVDLGLNIAELHHNRGIALFNLQQPQLALACVNHALQHVQGTTSAVMHNTKGYILQSLQRMQEALHCYQIALSLQPDMPLARLNLGIVQLTLGHWEDGWAGYEWRWTGAFEASQGRVQRIETSLPQWCGEPVNSEDGILIFAEQGLGDTLQFCRYLPLLCQQFSRVRLVCPQPLERLLSAAFGDAVEIGTAAPVDQRAWQWHCPLMSLPLAFKTTLDNLPAAVPYLRVDAATARPWAQRLQARAGGSRPCVGLCWAGAQGLKDDAKRSMALGHLELVLQQKNVLWVSLQKGDAMRQQEQLAPDLQLLDWTNDLHDLADTAALVSQLDLVITVDTAVAHLAGALAKPVWLLNRFESEWRWLRERDDSPWYPSLRLFTQTTPGDWAGVVGRVQDSLNAAFPPLSCDATPTT